MWKAGHSLMKAKIKEIGALLGAEMAGHIFFGDRYYGFDDAIYAGARLIELCADSQRPLSQMLSDLPKTYSTPELRIDCPEEIKFEVVRKAQDFFVKKYDTVTLDGVRIVLEDGWALVRASNTQPVLVLRFEANSESRLQEIKKLVNARLSDFIGQVTNGA